MSVTQTELDRRFADVRLELPNTDAESLVQAAALADAVRAELAELEPEQTLDEMMQALRGRPWAPQEDSQI